MNLTLKHTDYPKDKPITDCWLRSSLVCVDGAYGFL